MKIENLKIKIFADGAKITDFEKLNKFPYIKGFTTNPSLMRKAGITNYEKFINEILPVVGNKPISFEVVSDEFNEMEKQALKLGRISENIYVKIPVTNTKGKSSAPLIHALSHNGIKINVTAVFTLSQICEVYKVLNEEVPSIISIFSGRIADTGVDPAIIMKQAIKILNPRKKIELLWASPRELLNIFQAEKVGCDIITILPNILEKLSLINYNLQAYSLDTIKMFYNDAISSGLIL